mmetsp:Transcript_19577/g.47345  ORF Transcript_19577/g.47345 Transcript_19577/m.47345 type:complete len:315 (-) Transcript_19577:1316-2260(-)
MPGLLTHQASLCWLESICNGRPDVGSDVNQQHLSDRQCGGNTDQLRERGHDLWDLRAQCVHDRLFQILRAQPALAHCIHHRRKFVIKQHDVCSLLGDLCPTDAHGHTDLSSLQGRSIVHPIAGHGHNGASNLLVRADNYSLVDWRNPSEDPCVLHCLPPEFHLLFAAGPVLKPIPFRHISGQLVPSDHRVLTDFLRQIRQLIFSQDSNAGGNRLCCGRVITGHHHSLAACIIQHRNCILDSFLWRVLQPNETHPRESLHGKVTLLRARSLEDEIIRVSVQPHLREAQHPSASGHELMQMGVDLTTTLITQLHGG